MAKYKSTGELLAFIGGIVGLLLGILSLFGWGFLNYGFLGALGWIYGIVQIIVSLIILATCGKINIPALKLEKSGIIILILGIVLAIFGGTLGGVITIIGGILMLL